MNKTYLKTALDEVLENEMPDQTVGERRYLRDAIVEKLEQEFEVYDDTDGEGYDDVEDEE